jgi:hypothetical protein
LQVVPLGAYFSNRHHRLLAHQSGGNAIATLALGHKNDSEVRGLVTF